MNLFKDLQTLKKQCVIQIESIKKEYENKQIMFFSVTNKVAKIDFVAYSFGALIDSEWVVNELNQLHFNSYADKCKIPRASVFGTYLWNLESPAEILSRSVEHPGQYWIGTLRFSWSRLHRHQHCFVDG